MRPAARRRFDRPHGANGNVKASRIAAFATQAQLGYSETVSFFPAMIAEMGARRKRLRAAFGDRAQSLTEFLVLSGLIVGSLGLLIAPWMPSAAPWGFALPFAFLAGYVLVEVRRQRAVERRRAYIAEHDAEMDEAELNRFRRTVLEGKDPLFRADQLSMAEDDFHKNVAARRQARLAGAAADVAANYDWAIFIWSMACAVAGAAAFFIAWQARPAPPAEPNSWTPPENSVSVDLQP